MNDAFFLAVTLVLFGAAGVFVRERPSTPPETRR
jgi:hypothetical protein